MLRSLPERDTAKGLMAEPLLAEVNQISSLEGDQRIPYRLPTGAELFLLALAIGADDGDGAFIITSRIFVISEGHPLAVGRNFGVADPVDAVEKNLAERILQTPVIVLRHVSHNGQVETVGCPVDILDVVEHFARRAAAQGDAGERTGARVATIELRAEPDCELAVSGNREQLGFFEAEFAGTGIVSAGDVELALSAIPCGAVDDAAIRREARVADESRPEGDLLVGGLRDVSSGTAEEPSQAEESDCKDNCGGYDSKRFAPAAVRNGLGECGTARG